MRVLGLIMARGGSKGVPHKNIRMCAGKPLIVWTIEAAKKSKLITDLWVSSDDKDIREAAWHAGANILAEPPSDGSNPLIERIQWAAIEIEKKSEPYDVVADLRVTNPFKTAEDIDGAIKKLIKSGADVVCGVTQLQDHHPSRIKMIVNDQLVDVWPEPLDGLRQSLRPEVYIRNGSLYVMSREAMLNGIHFAGGTIRPWVMPEERGLNIDSEMDFQLAEVMLNAIRSGSRE